MITSSRKTPVVLSSAKSGGEKTMIRMAGSILSSLIDYALAHLVAHVPVWLLVIT